jgi:ABC-type phosphate transport system substrate-binding protein
MISLSSKLILILLLFPLAIFAEDKPIAASSIVPIVSTQHQQQSITRNGLGAIFKMRLQQWRDGSPVKVFVLDDTNPIHNAFCKKILNIFPHQLRRTWNKLVFSGSGQAPTKLKNKETMLTKIANTPGAIGYISVDDLTDQIKVLDIQ